MTPIAKALIEASEAKAERDRDMETAKHTQTPWRLEVARTMAHLHGPRGYTGISLPYKTAQDKANAEFIVRACNAHEDLVGELRACLLRLRKYSDELAELSRTITYDDNPENIDPNIFSRIEAGIVAALRSAGLPADGQGVQ